MRRALLCVAALLAVAVSAQLGHGSPGAPGCSPTPEDGFGPFTRVEPPLRSKIGTGHVLSGVVLSALDCRPIRGAHAQFWQADRRGRYRESGSGTVVTDRAGRFRFEGPFPPSYEGRPPHIHIRVLAEGHVPLLTRYVARKGVRSAKIRLVLRPDDL